MCCTRERRGKWGTDRIQMSGGTDRIQMSGETDRIQMSGRDMLMDGVGQWRRARPYEIDIGIQVYFRVEF
jgi:hypothetical protein